MPPPTTQHEPVITDAKNPFLRGEYTVEVVAKALVEDGDWRVRAYAAIWLGRQGGAAAEAVPALARALSDSNDFICSKASEALGWMGPAAAPAVSALADTVRGDTINCRRDAALALGRLGAVARDAAPALAQALGQQNSHETLQAVAYALTSVAPDDPSLPTIMASRLDIPFARRFMEERPDFCAQTIDVLIAEADKAGEVRTAAVRLLGRVGPPAARAVPVLYRLLEDGNPDRTTAAKALASIRPEAALRGWDQ